MKVRLLALLLLAGCATSAPSLWWWQLNPTWDFTVTDPQGTSSRWGHDGPYTDLKQCQAAVQLWIDALNTPPIVPGYQVSPCVPTTVGRGGPTRETHVFMGGDRR